MHIENNGNKIKHLRKGNLKLNYPVFKCRTIGESGCCVIIQILN